MSSLTTPTGQPTSPRISQILLPSDKYKLYCWRVRNGSSVRAGETVALAKLKEDDGATKSPPSEESAAETTASSHAATISSQVVDAPVENAASRHKRPTRRKRPGAVIHSAIQKDEVTTNTTPEATGQITADEEKREPARMKTNEEGDKFPHLDPLKKMITSLNKDKKETLSTTAFVMPKNSNLVALIAPSDGLVRMGPPKDSVTALDKLGIGYIEACGHPTVIDQLCAVCGKPIEAKVLGRQQIRDPAVHPVSSAQTRNAESRSNMSHVTVSGLTVSISETEAQRMSQQDAQRLRKQQKLSLVLDLDHTLVHATNDIRARRHCLERDDVRSLILPFMEQHQQQQHAQTAQPVWMQHFVKLRPYVKEFLQTALELFEVGVYTAGTREYAEQIALMLSRHLVGASRDQVDLEDLRRRAAMAEAELRQSKAREEEKGGKTEPTQEADQNPDNQGEESLTGKKRKRVTFGEVPASQKTDKITEAQVAEIRAELDQADRLEAQAQEMRQRLFGSRVVSRTDVGDLGPNVKSLRRIFPCGGTMAVVVDDREDVWANAGDVTATRKGEPPENLLLVHRYHWRPFIGFADVNNPAGADLSQTEANNDAEKSQSGEETDEQLLWTADILKRLHDKFYEAGEQSEHTVAEVLQAMRHRVLLGGKVVLSGLVPLHKQNFGPNVPRPPVIRYVEAMGAIVQSNVTVDTTHVVGAKDGTDKILKARQVRGCFVVKPSWLMECLWSLTRRNEQDHLLGPVLKDTTVAPLGSSRMENASSSSDEDEDDELAAEFENELMEEKAS